MEEEPSLAQQLRYLTYSQAFVNDHTLDCNLPLLKVRHRSRSPRRPPRVNAGILDNLPTELLHEILPRLDLCTLADFRRVNRRARELADSLPQYRTIHTHARDALQGIRSIGTGRWITCETLYQKLCTYGCEQCGDFGGYLYLLTCKRVCFLCFTQHRLYLPLTRGNASLKFGLSKHMVDQLPHMRALPGSYSTDRRAVSSPYTLVDYGSALQAGISLHGSSDAMKQYVTAKQDERYRDYRRRNTAARESGSTAHVRQPPALHRFDGQSGDPFRFVAIVPAPWWDKEAQEANWGFHCAGCESSSSGSGSRRDEVLRHSPWDPRRKFTVASFHEHIKQLGSIRDGEYSPYHVGKGQI